MNGKQLVNWFIETCNANTIRVVNETGRTVTVQVVMSRANYEKHVDPRVDPEYQPTNSQTDWRGELRGIQQYEGKTTRADTSNALYTYDLLIFKF